MFEIILSGKNILAATIFLVGAIGLVGAIIAMIAVTDNEEY